MSMTDRINEIKLELFENQNKIIRLQSDAIYDLYDLLSQHLEAAELDRLPVKAKIDKAAMLRAELNL